ncbi:arabinofuranosidase catalytic domain-containing protein [Nonomuraea jabiensis]|uniref:Alpha-L-arabinofuranosidase B catalytic domain-containing protein n=1 Tax=Nonomuraea jabiensis TaxID=882448 RepID=A0A7W9G2F9_9ACTN|nr:hypothetical protein [Nonomuraea jabiensis]
MRAAHSTTRALYASYNGPLYQVRRASDNATHDIGVLSAGGGADAIRERQSAAMQGFRLNCRMATIRHLSPSWAIVTDW